MGQGDGLRPFGGGEPFPGFPASARRVALALRAAGVDAPVRVFDASTRTAQDAAAAVGCEVGQIVKSLVFIAAGRPVLALCSGAHRVDTAKLARLCGSPVRRATAEEARAATGFAIGGIPPVGHVQPLVTLVDESLLAYPVVWAAAGTPTAVFPIAPADLVRVTGGRVADLREDSR